MMSLTYQKWRYTGIHRVGNFITAIKKYEEKAIQTTINFYELVGVNERVKRFSTYL